MQSLEPNGGTHELAIMVLGVSKDFLRSASQAERLPRYRLFVANDMLDSLTEAVISSSISSYRYAAHKRCRFRQIDFIFPPQLLPTLSFYERILSITPEFVRVDDPLKSRPRNCKVLGPMPARRRRNGSQLNM